MVDPGETRSLPRPLAGILLALAALLGAAGVAISAAAAHRGGGSMAANAGLFCLLHAGAVTGLASWGRASPGPSNVLVAVGAVALVIGTAMFAGDLALAGLYGWRPFPPAAPIGGGAMLIGWLAVFGGAVLAAIRR